MTTSVTLLAAGATSQIMPITPLQSVCAGPAVLGGTVTLYSGPTQSGPWSAWSAGASSSAASFRPSVNSYFYVVCATQAAVVAMSDMGTGQGASPLADAIVSCNAAVASPSTTSEVGLYSFRLPSSFLKPNFKLEIEGVASFTNNANAKTLQVRMNGLAGTLIHQSAALASLANYQFRAAMAGIGDGATLKGMGAGSAGGFGTSTTALTTLARDYINLETEIVVSCTKATGTDTFQLDAIRAVIYQ